MASGRVPMTTSTRRVESVAWAWIKRGPARGSAVPPERVHFLAQLSDHLREQAEAEQQEADRLEQDHEVEERPEAEVPREAEVEGDRADEETQGDENRPAHAEEEQRPA